MPDYKFDFGDSDTSVDPASNIESTILKIMAENPKIGFALMEKYQGRGDSPTDSYVGGFMNAVSPGSSESGWKGGFWGDVWNVTGAAALRGAGQLLTTTPGVKEVIELDRRVLAAGAEAVKSQTGAGEEVTPAWEDIWRGLTGKTHTTFADTFASWASAYPESFIASKVEGNESGGTPADYKARFEDYRDRSFFKAMGLTADIAADPLTYTKFFGKGAKTVSEATRAAEEVTRLGAKTALETGELSLGNAGKAIAYAGDKGIELQFGDVAHANYKAMGLSDEAAEAMASMEERNIVDGAVRTVDDVIRVKAGWAGQMTGDAVAKQGAASVIKDTAKFVDPFGDAWTGKQLKSFLKEGRSFRPTAANLAKLPEDHWLRNLTEGVTGTTLSRRSAAALGGARFEVSFPWAVRKWARATEHPFFAYRYSFPMWDYPAGMPTRSIGRFMRGNAHLNRLETLMNNPHVPFYPKDMDIWASQGASGLRRHMYDTGRLEVFEKAMGTKMWSPMMSLSERVGKFTGGLTRSAELWRKDGFHGVLMADTIRTAKTGKTQLKSWALEHAPEWAPVVKRLSTETEDAKAAILMDGYEFLEGNAAALERIPEYLHESLKQMGMKNFEMWSKLTAEGVDLGNFQWKLAARHASEAYTQSKHALGKIDEELEFLKPLERKGPMGRKLRQQFGFKDESVVRVRVSELMDDREVVVAAKKSAGKGTSDKYQKAKGLTGITGRMKSYDKMYKALGGDPQVVAAIPTNHFHLMFASDARKAIIGNFDPKDPVAVARAATRKKELNELERTLVMGIREAEKTVRANPKYATVLANVPKVFENDIFSVWMRYTDKMAEALYTSKLSKGAKSVIKEAGAVDNGIATKVAPPDLIRRIEALDAKRAAKQDDIDILFEKLAPGLPLDPQVLTLAGQHKYQQLLTSFNKMDAELLGLRARPEAALKRVEDIDARVWKAVGLPGFEGLYMHPYMAAELHRAMRGLKDPGDLLKLWRGYVNGPWKKGSTVYWYGFHWRNHQGALFNNFIGRGMDALEDTHDSYKALKSAGDAELAKKVWKKNVRIDGVMRKEVTYGELYKMASDMNMVGANGLALADLYNYLPSRYGPLGTSSKHNVSNFFTEKLHLKATVPVPKIGRAKTANAARADVKYNVASAKLGHVRVGVGNIKISPEAMMREWEREGTALALSTENLHRTAGFVGGLMESGGDTKAARAYSMMRHGDYEDLTDWEDRIRDVIPFFKWMRTNTPYQVRNLFERPGSTVFAYDKTKRALVGDEDRNNLAQWMQKEMLIKVPGLNSKLPGSEKDAPAWFMVMDLPMNDLYMGSREFFANMAPVVKPFIENLVLKESIFTGAPLVNKPEKLAGWIQASGIDNILESLNIGERDADGDITLSDKTINVLNIAPIFSRFRNFLSGDEKRKALRFNSFTSIMLGFGNRPVTYEGLQDEERRFFYDEVQPVYDHLKELGYEFPTAEQFAEFNKRYNTSP